jgi:Prolyl oligopeptidase family
MIRRFILLVFFLTLGNTAFSQKEIPLYSGKIPNTKDTPDEEEIVFNKEVDTLAFKVSHPTLTVFLPPAGKACGTAVVISLSDSLGHIGSREYLLGKNPTEERIRYFSNELQVNKSTPPSFLILAGDDSVVKPQNSLSFYDALKKNGIPAEMHIYQSGEHGFLKTPPFEEWFGRCCFWMKNNGWLE